MPRVRSLIQDAQLGRIFASTTGSYSASPTSLISGAKKVLLTNTFKPPGVALNTVPLGPNMAPFLRAGTVITTANFVFQSPIFFSPYKAPLSSRPVIVRLRLNNRSTGGIVYLGQWPLHKDLGNEFLQGAAITLPSDGYLAWDVLQVGFAPYQGQGLQITLEYYPPQS